MKFFLLNKSEIEELFLLGTRGKTKYWMVDAACLITGTDEETLNRLLARVAEVKGISVWWDYEDENSGEYDFGISICDAHLFEASPHDRTVCTCESGA